MTKLKRKLTTAFSADVAGYSRLMCRDEDTTVITLSAYRKILSALIERHQGRVVDAVGDNILAEFGCAVDAVECALSVQAEVSAQNAQLSEDKWMCFRIGINYGQVIEEGGRLYGTGINIAARLQALASTGGVCVSGSVFSRVRDVMTLQYEYLGKFNVKNICKQVEVFRVITKNEENCRDKKYYDRTQSCAFETRA
ncbi:MAG: adenylate/guanylate cyclase domain-containing protein [Desulfohalobiaceae bacterium]|nr:adenylate/guanylate cyclase domain-containing protein [Desulfohalobiaceae bacterium]